ncbi:MAG: PBP1A family penicillin-binding protein [Pseudomonadota bacterium]
MTRRAKKTAKKPAPQAASGGWLWAVFKWVFVYGIIGCAACLVATYAMILYLSGTLTDPKEALVASGAAPLQIVASTGEVLANYGPNQGDWVDYADIPPDMIDAMIAIEDRRFFQHGGLDFRSIARAALSNFRAGAVTEGGSTITQQLAKNLYLDPSRTLTRKLREAMMSIALEHRYSKQDILAAYLNRVYLGSGAYGIEAASFRFFGKTARNLSLGEAALLAGIVKAPSRLSPKVDLQAALDRRALVLAAMAEEGFISASEAKLVAAIPINLVQTAGDPQLRYFTDWVSARVRSRYPAGDMRLKVKTTLDLKAQAAAQKAVKAHLPEGHAPTAELQVALAALDDTGAVRALVGGRDYTRSSYNRATQAVRQPGSAFKTFVYLAALENGLEPASKLRDTPIQLGSYAPKNYGGGYSGRLITLADAYSRSVNTIAVKLGERVDRPKVASMARRLGLTTPIVVEPSIALGTSEVHVVELAAAYAVIANGGMKVRPYAIAQVRGPRGGVIQPVEVPMDDQGTRVLERRIAWQMARLMQLAVEQGTGRNARTAGRPIAGKTGTTQNGQDGWFVGFSDRLTAAVWIGRDDNKSVKGLTGGGMPARLWGDFIAAAQTGENPAPLLRADRRAFNALQESDTASRSMQ